jgi:predicted dehydrogenase
MKLRLGLLGHSIDWRTRHLPALRMLQDRFEVVGVYCAVNSFADAVARELGAPKYDGFRELIRRDEVDAVMVLESHWNGILPILAACDYGKAVYCGSEIDFDPQEAETVRQQIDKSGIAFMAEFPRRFAPASIRLKELLATRLGAPQLLFCHRRLTSESGRGRSLQARADRELMELMDWCSFIVGRPIRSVMCAQHAARNSTDTNVPDYRSLSADLSAPDAPLGTTVAQISCGTYFPNAWAEAIAFRPPASVQVCCEKGLVFVDLPNQLVWFDQAGRHQETLDSELPVGQLLLSQFHRSITSLVRKISDLDDVYRNLRALEAARDSIAQRKAIDLC